MMLYALGAVGGRQGRRKIEKYLDLKPPTQTFFWLVTQSFLPKGLCRRLRDLVIEIKTLSKLKS